MMDCIVVSLAVFLSLLLSVLFVPFCAAGKESRSRLPAQQQLQQPEPYFADEEQQQEKREGVCRVTRNGSSAMLNPDYHEIFDTSIWYHSELKQGMQITISLIYGLIMGFIRQKEVFMCLCCVALCAILMLELCYLFVVGDVFSNKQQYSKVSTYTLVCMASCLLTVIGHSPRWLDPPHGDVYRIQAAVIQGVGFMGAGFILRVGNNVVGMTNAASIFMTAALGIGVGYGYYVLTAWVVLLLVVGHITGIIQARYFSTRQRGGSVSNHGRGQVQNTGFDSDRFDSDRFDSNSNYGSTRYNSSKVDPAREEGQEI
jgi:uncharacterized membrane protein YhiD involved in acid resistance